MVMDVRHATGRTTFRRFEQRSTEVERGSSVWRPPGVIAFEGVVLVAF